ncbi:MULTISPECIES: hypothetical protein [Sporosarcina]|uniref:DUF2304 domain-containing protein n=1 Tax=Sporosarcina contaminans TaxID=633403 RepID=A0ABW3U1H6_9BACL
MNIHSMFIAIAVLIIAGQLLTILFIMKNRFVFANRFLLYCTSILPVLIAFQLGLLNGTVIDELGMNGNATLFYLIIAIISLGLLTLWFSFSISAKIEKTAAHSSSLE